MQIHLEHADATLLTLVPDRAMDEAVIAVLVKLFMSGGHLEIQFADKTSKTLVYPSQAEYIEPDAVAKLKSYISFIEG